MKKIVLILILLYIANANAQSKRYYSLIMRTTGTIDLWDGKKTTVYGFASKLSQNPPVPGPLIEANEGDSVIVDVRNLSQGPPHTIHWHGLDVDQQNDGTPSTSFEIHHMELATYRFKATHAGTYIYHCHMGDVVHVQMGMYGMVIIHPFDSSKRAWSFGPAYDTEYHWLTSEIDKSWHDTVPNTNHKADSMSGHETFDIPLYKPDYFLVNGKSHQQIKADSSTSIYNYQNQILYLRIGNIGYLQNRITFPKKCTSIIMDSDGRPVPTGFRDDTLWVSPGERYGVFMQCFEELIDSISIEYINMNTHQTVATEWVPVNIAKFNSLAQANNAKPLTVFPNPTQSSFHIQFPEQPHVNYHLYIYDNSGALVMQNNAIRSSTELQSDSLPQGLYYITLVGNDGSRFVGKMVVQ